MNEISNCKLASYALLKEAAYASSSASSLPTTTFAPSIASFGFINQPTAGDAGSALSVSDSLTAGRGCPVGDAAAGRSPVLLASPPEQLNQLQDQLNSPYPLHFQASSTPMVTQVFSVCKFQMISSFVGYYRSSSIMPFLNLYPSFC